MVPDWKRSFFLVLDDDLVNPEIPQGEGNEYTKHSFTITSPTTQQAFISINMHDTEIYPDTNPCRKAPFGSPASATAKGARAIWEANIGSFSGAGSHTVDTGSTYYLNDGQEITLTAGVEYSLDLWMWGGNEHVIRDFSVVALSESDDVTFVHASGLQSDSYWTSEVTGTC